MHKLLSFFLINAGSLFIIEINYGTTISVTDISHWFTVFKLIVFFKMGEKV